MRRRLRALYATLVAFAASSACASVDPNAPIAPDDWPAIVADLCATGARCCAAVGGTFERVLCEADGPTQAQLAARYTWNGDEARLCARAMASRWDRCPSSLRDADAVALFVHCSRILTGRADLGDRCQSNLDCKASPLGVVACWPEGAYSTCGVTYTVGPGERCGYLGDGHIIHCDETTYCLEVDGSQLAGGTCIPRLTHGAACALDRECPKGDLCTRSGNVCDRAPDFGEPCPDGVCTEGNACTNGVCTFTVYELPGACKL